MVQIVQTGELKNEQCKLWTFSSKAKITKEYCKNEGHMFHALRQSNYESPPREGVTTKKSSLDGGRGDIGLKKGSTNVYILCKVLQFVCSHRLTCMKFGLKIWASLYIELFCTGWAGDFDLLSSLSAEFVPTQYNIECLSEV